jgi:hypothetical protein
MAKNGKNGMNGSKVERVVVAMTALALNAPSTYTIAWSKGQHQDELPVLYAGIGTSAVTVLGAILGDRYHGEKIMWGGLIGTLALFGYVAFCYKPSRNENPNPSQTVNPPLIISGGEQATHFMV